MKQMYSVAVGILLICHLAIIHFHYCLFVCYMLSWATSFSEARLFATSLPFCNLIDHCNIIRLFLVYPFSMTLRKILWLLYNRYHGYNSVIGAFLFDTFL